MLNELICYAERKRDEAAECDDIATARYWVGYIDALFAALKIIKNSGG